MPKKREAQIQITVHESELQAAGAVADSKWRKNFKICISPAALGEA